MRLPSPYREEAAVAADRLARLGSRLDWAAAMQPAREWVRAVRSHPAPFWAMERLLHEYPISSAEGLALMRLAEALSRVPDIGTAIALTADQLGRADFTNHGGDSTLAHLASAALSLSQQFLPEAGEHQGLWARIGARGVVAASLRAVQLLGHQFVLGESIEGAMRVAAAQRESQSRLRFSYDMLGEGARTEEDALHYLQHYRHAIETLAVAQRTTRDLPDACRTQDGISIKLSALHPRYEWAHRDRVLQELVPRVWSLCEMAATANLNFTMDAEEVDRLEISLDVFEAIIEKVARHHGDWQGFGLAIQAYQTRALDVIEHVIGLAHRHGVRLMCRLVKGAYWDSEIKRAQEMGLPHYPVFTHKSHTDVSWLACAATMLEVPDLIFPQFATHNAGSIAALMQLARAADAPFELQRLHGMGESVYRELLKTEKLAVRVYAPVGAHRDLLAYLVRRLLENGANASFVHQLADAHYDEEALLASPLVLQRERSLPLPREIFGSRLNALGLDLSEQTTRDTLLVAYAHCELPHVQDADPAQIDTAIALARAAFPAWRDRSAEARSLILRQAADRLECELPRFCALLVKEAYKTWNDALAEVREAVDFLRYYALEVERVMQVQTLPGPTGELDTLQLRGRGVWVCISPWNFPLAIFTGQVAAALVTGNAVLAKPAEQTPAVAAAMVSLLHEQGVPRDVLQLLHGPGETVGATLVAHPHIDGVVFTGSTQVARLIQRTLAAKEGPIVPLIAETGGINALIADSSALPEQVADAVLQSAFRSAGQRCSALRLLCVQEDIADRVIGLVVGSARELRAGPAVEFATDLGRLIDGEAFARIEQQLRGLRERCKPLLVPEREVGEPSYLLAPHVFEVRSVADLREEIFGPVLQVLRWSGDPEKLVDEINAIGYGLTLGIHTRIDRRAQALARRARVGNVYINRNVIGAVVGVQPFGGEGLSGTGPKAGGPHYLPRFCTEQTVTVNTAAAGGNAALLAGDNR